MCGCGRARRARLRGLRGLRCQRCAQTGDGAALRGALGLRGLPGNLGRSKSRRALWGALAALCAAVALRGRARPPPGTGVPVWRLRAARLGYRRVHVRALLPALLVWGWPSCGHRHGVSCGHRCARVSAIKIPVKEMGGISHQAKNSLGKLLNTSQCATLARK